MAAHDFPDLFQGDKPAYGHRLPTSLIDYRAKYGHSRPCALIPTSNSLQDGFQEVSFTMLANAINRCAYWLRERLGDGQGRTVAYVGPTDLRYLILAWAGLKSGYVMFLPSPRIPAEVLDILLQRAEATAYLSSSQPSAPIAAILKNRLIESHCLPSLAELLDEKTVESFPYDSSLEYHRHRPFVKLHTSGSTGVPKVVTVKNGVPTAIDAYHLLEQNEIADRCGNMRVLAPFPLFHVAGLLLSINLMLWVESTLVILPTIPITAELIHNAVDVAKVEHCQLTPSLIADLVQNPAWLAGLAKLKGITFAGGALGDDIAATVASKTKLYSTLGATEYGSLPMVRKDDEDWKYFRFNEKAVGMVFEETDSKGLYEMVFRRSNDEICKLTQTIFINFPDIDEYRTKDCFSKHPSKPNLWKYETRIDDIIVLSNGENVSTVPMEGTINFCPIVASCLVVGQGKFQTALLVERRDSNLSEAEAARILEPFIARANAASPSFARIAYDKVLYTDPQKPLPKTAKGSLQRSKANALYHAEIEALFRRTTQLVAPADRVKIVISDVATTESSILAYLKQTLNINKEDTLSANDDFFVRGMDSLQVLSLAQDLNLSRSNASNPVTPAFIYNHSTAAKLASALALNKEVKQYSDFDDDDEDMKQNWLDMEHAFQDLRDDDNEKGGFDFKAALRSKNKAPIFQPDGGSRAWMQVFGSFLINIANWGLINSFGVFQTYYATELLRNHSQADIAWIGTVQGALLLIVGVIAGPVFDKGYFRTAGIIAGLGLVFGLIMLSLATEYYQVMLSQGVLLGICSGFLYVPSVALVPLYFKRYRGLALGIATAGGPFGGVIYPIIFRRLLDTVGFGWATRVIGFVTLAILIVAGMMMQPLGPRSTRKLFEVDAWKEAPFVSFTFSAFFSFAGLLVPFFLVANYGQSQVGLSQDLSFYALAILNGAQLFGRLIPALISDWVGPEMILLGGNTLIFVVAFCWIAIHNSAGYLVWLVFYGFMSGIPTVLPAAVLPYICPNLAVIGTRLGMLYAAAGVGFLISTPVALTLLSDAGGFLGPQCWTGACLALAAVFNFLPVKEARERRLLYEATIPGGRKMYLWRKSGSA